MRISILCLIIFSALIACKKEKIDINSYWQCNTSQNLDTAAISTKLKNSWTWAKQSCFWNGKTKLADKNIIIIFKSDYSFLVQESSNILTQGTWRLQQVDGNSWGLDLSSTSEYLWGRILFCENQLLLNDSYRDGCDNLFYKKN